MHHSTLEECVVKVVKENGEENSSLKTTYSSKGPEVTPPRYLRSQEFRRFEHASGNRVFQTWNFDPIPSESRNWPDEDLQGQVVHAKNWRIQVWCLRKGLVKSRPDNHETTRAISCMNWGRRSESTNYYPGRNTNKQFFFEAGITSWITITVTGLFFDRIIWFLITNIVRLPSVALPDRVPHIAHACYLHVLLCRSEL